MKRPRHVLADPEKVDRLPPHAQEAEQGILGCILLDPPACIAQCVETLKFGDESFYDLRHRVIYTTLLVLWDKKIAIDIVTLQQTLKDKQQLEAVGGLAYISSLPDAVPSAANLEYYIEIVNEKALARNGIQVCTAAVARIYEEEGEIDKVFDQLEQEVLDLSKMRVAERAMVPIKDLIHKSITQIEAYHANAGKILGIATGFSDLDKMTQGLKDGNMIVIAARPSVGKTSLAMNIAEKVAVDDGKPVGVFSLEMTSDELILRMLCSRARVNLLNIREGFLAERDFPKLTGAAGKISTSPLYIDDTSGLSIMALRAKARRMKQEHDIKLLVIDYLQLLHSTNRKVNSRQEEIADISSGVKQLAKELGIPIIILSQLNRDIEREKGRKPRLADLRESGSIEQDADLVGLLYRLQKTEEEENNPNCDAESINLLLAKQRNGPTGEINLTFLRSFTRFESAARIAADDVPTHGNLPGMD